MKISLNDSRRFEREGFNGNVYIDKKDGVGLNALLVECVTRHYKTKLLNATRGYLIVEGEGSFVINEKEHKAELFDLFIIFDGDTYSYEGKMKLFEFNVPATDSSNEEKLE